MRQVATLLGNRKQSIVTSWTYAMWNDAIKIKALSLQPTKQRPSVMQIGVYVKDLTVCDNECM